ncbi:MAG: hypothetical protein KAT26_05370 [Marinosulfonomonas sp.]|nr:hypothetical protein [Marinosulfonomonas sp.]
MKFNKSHEIWKSAPWHVKLSVLGVPSLKMLYVYGYIAFFAGLLFFLGRLALPLSVNAEILKLAVWGSALPLASCMYLFAIIWVKDNPDCLDK